MYRALKLKEPVIMIYRDGGPRDTEIEYKKGFMVYQKAECFFIVGEYETYQTKSPERLHGTPYYISKKVKMDLRYIPKTHDDVEKNLIDDALRMGTNIIEVSNINLIDLVISRHAENLYKVPITNIFWDESSKRKIA